MRKMSWCLWNAGILFVIVISPVLQGTSCAQEEAWRIPVIVTGQKIAGINSKNKIYIAMDANAATYLYPPLIDSTAYISLNGDCGDLYEDIRKIGSESEVWHIKVKISKYADRSLEGYYPELSWDPNDEMDIITRFHNDYDYQSGILIKRNEFDSDMHLSSSV